MVADPYLMRELGRLVVVSPVVGIDQVKSIRRLAKQHFFRWLVPSRPYIPQIFHTLQLLIVLLAQSGDIVMIPQPFLSSNQLMDVLFRKRVDKRWQVLEDGMLDPMCSPLFIRVQAEILVHFLAEVEDDEDVEENNWAVVVSERRCQRI